MKPFHTRYIKSRTGCWLWAGCLTKSGYGDIHKTPFKKIYGYGVAHRLSYFLHFGDFDKSLQVNHLCHVRSCVNPNHLYLGTQLDNMNDMHRSGRCKAPKGELHHNAKLTESEVLQIRDLLMYFSERYIGSLYGVSQKPIRRIKNGTGWRHL